MFRRLGFSLMEGLIVIGALALCWSLCLPYMLEFLEYLAEQYGVKDVPEPPLSVRAIILAASILLSCCMLAGIFLLEVACRRLRLSVFDLSEDLNREDNKGLVSRGLAIVISLVTAYLLFGPLTAPGIPDKYKSIDLFAGLWMIVLVFEVILALFAVYTWDGAAWVGARIRSKWQAR